MVGFTFCINEVILVEYVLCEPSKAGRAAMVILVSALREQWRSLTIRCFCEVANRRMIRFVESLGGRPAAIMLEVPKG